MSGTLYLFENNKIESQKHPLYYNSDAKNVDTDRQVSYHQIKRRKCIIGTKYTGLPKIYFNRIDTMMFTYRVFVY